jgi:hypothetical protein
MVAIFGMKTILVHVMCLFYEWIEPTSFIKNASIVCFARFFRKEAPAIQGV